MGFSTNATLFLTLMQHFKHFFLKIIENNINSLPLIIKYVYLFSNICDFQPLLRI